MRTAWAQADFTQMARSPILGRMRTHQPFAGTCLLPVLGSLLAAQEPTTVERGAIIDDTELCLDAWHWWAHGNHLGSPMLLNTADGVLGLR